MKKLLKKLSHHFASPLPITVPEFNSYCEEIFTFHNIPDLPSYRHAVASMIMHLNTQTNKIPKKYFVRSIRKAQANEIAFNMMQTIKEEEKKKANEVATPTKESPPFEPIQNDTI